MSATYIRFIAGIPCTECPDCGQALREAVLINQYDLVLARARVCSSCGHRHRLDTTGEPQAIAG